MNRCNPFTHYHGKHSPRTEEELEAHEEAVKQLMKTDIGTIVEQMDDTGEDVVHFQVEFSDAVLDVHITLRSGVMQ